MDNAMVMAEHGRGVDRRLLRRLAAFGAGVIAVFAMAMVLFQHQAGAQINIQQIVCPILISLANTFGQFFGSIFSALLAAFGCVISG